MDSPKNMKTYHIGLWQAKTYRVLKYETTLFLRPYKITPIEWACLGVIYESSNKKLINKHISKILGVKEPYATRLVNKLIKSGFLSVNNDEPKDLRMKIINITLKGRFFVERTEAQLRDYMKKKLGKLSKLYLFGYMKTIKKIAEEW